MDFALWNGVQQDSVAIIGAVEVVHQDRVGRIDVDDAQVYHRTRCDCLIRVQIGRNGSGSGASRPHDRRTHVSGQVGSADRYAVAVDRCDVQVAGARKVGQLGQGTAG